MTIKDDLIKEIEEGKEIHRPSRVYGDISLPGFGLAEAVGDSVDLSEGSDHYSPNYVFFNITSGLCRTKDEAVRIFRLRLATHNPPKTGKLYWRQELTMESNQCFDNGQTGYRLSCQFAVSEQV